MSGEAADFCEVVVRVTNVADARGLVRVAVCQEGDWLRFDQPLCGQAPACRGVVSITLRPVPPGVYGVLAHHDANGDGRINRDLLGRPTEGIGFSRDAPILFGPPRFRDAALVFRAGSRVTVDLALRFEPNAPRPASGRGVGAKVP
jgi:uncharacterized protein (DUF2141 family)